MWLGIYFSTTYTTNLSHNEIIEKLDELILLRKKSEHSECLYRC